jgi:phosphate transport system substrate-binding protein
MNHTMKVRQLRPLGALVLAAALAACGGGQPPPAETASPALPGQGASATGGGGGAQINGAGATFPYPIYSKWFSEYSKSHPDALINYQSIGSGGGIRQLIAQTVFFGASDGPMTEEQLKSAPGPIVHLPTVLGGVVPAYNVPNFTGDLKFSGALLADIFLGKVKKWSDPAIAKENPGARLPSAEIVVAHRSDGSGTTYIWVDYLSKVSPEFKQKVGVATSVNWPVGVGGKGNEGVAGLVKQTPNAIGYVELIYALQNNIPFASVKNKAGTYVKATLDSVTAAAASTAASMPADFRVSITDADGKDAYPISSYTWILMYENSSDKDKARKMVGFMRWALTDGQTYTKDLGYAPLPEAVVKLEQDALGRIHTQ